MLHNVIKGTVILQSLLLILPNQPLFCKCFFTA
nr:MAG TPA: hypothetical protein [Caudoviricetes sp.]